MVVEGIGEGKGVGGDKGSHRKEYIGTKRKKRKGRNRGRDGTRGVVVKQLIMGRRRTWYAV